MRCAILALLAGCSFEHGTLAGDGSLRDDTTTSENGCTPGFVDLCGETPGGVLTIAGADTIDTDTDARCHTYTQASGGAVCLVYASSVELGVNASLTATGSRPLAIASASTLMIDGVIDVSSRRATNQIGPAADSAACMFAATPEEDLGGAGGGAGGSFGGIGGSGGTGDNDNSVGTDGTAAPGVAGPTAMPTVLRGGCRGQSGGNESSTGGSGGPGGHSGGALYLYAAQSIELTGVVRATAAGGEGGQVQAGGGGGGSGGLVVLEAPSISIGGQISANGGGGGEGGARVGSTPVDGQPGADGDLGTTPAAGGMGSDNRFGYGGAGGAGTSAAAPGVTAVVGGGGGGGGGGIVKLLGATTICGVISPPPM